ncbi:hypothetical protein VPH35_104707 [Triticum aestivum]
MSHRALTAPCVASSRRSALANNTRHAPVQLSGASPSTFATPGRLALPAEPVQHPSSHAPPSVVSPFLFSPPAAGRAPRVTTSTHASAAVGAQLLLQNRTIWRKNA